MLVTRTREQAEGLVDRLHGPGRQCRGRAADHDGAGRRRPRRSPERRVRVRALGIAAMGSVHERDCGSPRHRCGRRRGDCRHARRGRRAGNCRVRSKLTRGHAGPGCRPSTTRRGLGGSDAGSRHGRRDGVVSGRRGSARRLRRTRSRAGGATVIVQHIYRSVMPDVAPDRLGRRSSGGIDAITLTSGSTARHLVGGARR